MRLAACIGLVALAASCGSRSTFHSPDSGQTTGSGGDDGGGNATGSDGGTSGSGSNGSGGSGADDALVFAIVGDTRPPSVDDTANYPTDIIGAIYADIEAAAPRPQFAIGTGDYQFASTSGSQQQPQLDAYMTARAAFSGPLYPAMGNHECTGYTDSNCGTGNTDGVTKNMTAFISTMLAPIGQTKPYYVENLAAGDHSWTAKIVFVACNAWDSTQSTWLTQQLAVPTTYTFVVRHESAADMSGTKCSASQTTIDEHPLTLLDGRAHARVPPRAYDHEVIIGIGGAPLTSGTNYGYTIVTRNADGTLTVATYDYKTHKTIDSFTIKADGSAG